MDRQSGDRLKLFTPGPVDLSDFDGDQVVPVVGVAHVVATIFHNQTDSWILHPCGIEMFGHKFDEPVLDFQTIEAA